MPRELRQASPQCCRQAVFPARAAAWRRGAKRPACKNAPGPGPAPRVTLAEQEGSSCLLGYCQLCRHLLSPELSQILLFFLFPLFFQLGSASGPQSSCGASCSGS